MIADVGANGASSECALLTDTNWTHYHCYSASTVEFHVSFYPHSCF